MKLTAIQLQTLRFIDFWTREFGCPPSYREMGERFGVNPTAIVDRINPMIIKGALEREANKSRAIRVTRLGHKALGSHHRDARRFQFIKPVHCRECNAMIFGVGRCPMCGKARAA